MDILLFLFLALAALVITLAVLHHRSSDEQPPVNPKEPPQYIPQEVRQPQETAQSPVQPPSQNPYDMGTVTAPGQNPYESLYIPQQKFVSEPNRIPSQPLPPPAPKKPFSPLPPLLFAGVAFLFLGGIIFLTDTWEILSNPVRALLLLSASVIAFGMNFLAERILKLPKTGLAFYVLGSIFLPLALGGIGVFRLFGDWFSFRGEGRLIVLAVIFLSISITSFAGQHNYKNPPLAGIGIGSAGLSWLFLSLHLAAHLFQNETGMTAQRSTIFAVMLAAAAIALNLTGDFCCQKDPPTSFTKALPGGTYAVLLLYTIAALFLSADFVAAPVILGLTGLVLYLNPRYIRGGIHFGVIGFLISSLITLGNLSTIPAAQTADGFAKYLFTVSGTVILLISVGSVVRLPQMTQSTFASMGYACSLFALPAAMIYPNLTDDVTAYLYIPLLIALFCFANTPRTKLSRDSASLVILICLLYPAVLGSADLSNTLLTMLVLLGAALLIGVSLLSRKRWSLILAISACGALLLTRLPHPGVILSWFCTIALLGGTIYAHKHGRPLLERCCAWTGIVNLLMAGGGTALLVLTTNDTHAVVLAILLLVYLVERFGFASHSRSESTSNFCLYVSIYLSFLIWLGNTGTPWLMLGAVCLVIFSGAALQKKVNFLCIPLLLSLTAALENLVGRLPSLPAAALTVVQVLCYLGILLLLAGMGRLLLPRFYTADNQHTRIDWALIAGIFPVISMATTVNWHTGVLTCLLLAVYSLLYIGRTRANYIPAVMTSAFFCAALWQAQSENLFGIRTAVASLDMRTLSTLLPLIPVHLFLLSLVFLLPEKHRNSVHLARFLMYCFSTLCLLGAALYSGHTYDAILLAVLSLAVLLGSFTVKRLRWFTLGFGVLVLITLRMTAVYRHSIHWGVYLFLIGAALLIIAFRYEYVSRWKAEHPDEPVKKLALFKEWKW